MTFGQAIATCFSKYATFEGRATRSEFWWFALFQFAVYWGIQLVVVVLAAVIGIFGEMLGSVIETIVFLGLLLPSVAVAARRLHDTNRGGWNQLWAFTIIGLIPLLIWALTPGDAEANRFGEPVS